MSDSTPTGPTSPDDLERAITVSRAKALRPVLLALHRHLLESERRVYEKLHGRIEGNAAFLQVVINDPQFDWLRSLSQLLLELDDILEPESEVPEPQALEARVRRLLDPDPAGGPFQRRYDGTLQESPDAMLAHSAVMRVLNLF